MPADSLERSAPPRLAPLRLAVFSLPMILIQAVEIAWRIYLPGFFTAAAGLSLGTAGALLMAARLFDSLVDPAIAWASDRFPTRHGHRRPWLVASVPLLMLGTIGIYFIWPWTSLTSIFLSALIFHLGYTMLATPHGGWAVELGADAGERVRIIGAKTWFGVAGMIAIVMLPAALERGFAVDRAGQVAALGLILLLLAPLCVALIIMLVPEPVLPATRRRDLANPFRLFASILRMPALRPVFLLYLFSGFAEAASGAAFLFLIEDALALPGWGSSLLLLPSAVVVVTLPVWTRLAGRVGYRAMLMLAYGWMAVTAPVALLLPAGALAPAIGFLLLRGAFAGVDFLLLRTMVADVARASAAAGLRHGASCYAMSNITLKLAMGSGAWLALTLIAAAPETGDAGRALAVRLAYALPPVVAGMLGLIVLAPGVRRSLETRL